MDIRAKEKRKECLESIENFTNRMNTLLGLVEEDRVVSIVKLLSVEERMPYIQKLAEIDKLRRATAFYYGRLLEYQDVNQLPNRDAYVEVISVMKAEMQEYVRQLDEVGVELETTLNSIERVVGQTEVGYKYFNEMFDEIYDQNTEVWNDAAQLGAEIKKLNAEIHNQRLIYLASNLDNSTSADSKKASAILSEKERVAGVKAATEEDSEPNA